MPGGRAAIKEDFILAEMNNSVQFLAKCSASTLTLSFAGCTIPSTSDRVSNHDHDPGRRPGQLPHIFLHRA
jgi:hypothetical protein